MIYPSPSYCPLLSAENIGLSLLHLVPEIIGPKVGIFVHQHMSFDSFEAFYTKFLFDFPSS